MRKAIIRYLLQQNNYKVFTNFKMPFPPYFPGNHGDGNIILGS